MNRSVTHTDSCEHLTITSTNARSLYFHSYGSYGISNGILMVLPDYNENGNYKDTTAYIDCDGTQDSCKNGEFIGNNLKSVTFNCTKGNCGYSTYSFNSVCVLNFFTKTLDHVTMEFSYIDILYVNDVFWKNLCNYNGTSDHFKVDNTLIIINNGTIIDENDITSCIKYQKNEIILSNYNPKNITIYNNSLFSYIYEKCSYLGGIPTTMPPSMIPSVEPSAQPSEPSVMPTNEPTINTTLYINGNDNDNDNGSDATTTIDLSNSETLIFIIFIVLIIVVIIFVSYLVINNKMKNQNENENKNAINSVALSKIKSNSQYENYNQLNNHTAGWIDTSGNDNNNNNNNNNNNDNINNNNEYSHSKSSTKHDFDDILEDLVEEGLIHDSNNNEKLEIDSRIDNIDNIDNAANTRLTMSCVSEGKQINNEKDIDGNLVEVNDDDGKDDVEIMPNTSQDAYGTHGSRQLIDESNYHLWTQKQVLLWIKNQLLENQFDKQMILMFLKELIKKNVNGDKLKQFKQNDMLIDQFQQTFSNQNQTYVIWMVIKIAIESIGDHVHVTKGN